MGASWRHSRDYRVWRATVIRRDSRCVVCGSLKHRQAHHIQDASHFPDTRFDPENGVTLCSGCHTAFHTMFKRSFRCKCDRADWGNFNDLVAYLEEAWKPA